MTRSKWPETHTPATSAGISSTHKRQMKPIYFCCSLSWNQSRSTIFFFFLKAPQRIKKTQCLCVDLISLAPHEVMFFTAFLHTPRWQWEENIMWSETQFCFVFKQSKLPKTWLLAWAAITGTGHYDTHPPLPHTK